jgi:tetratricopeptide (TPR) repeat protein
MQDKVAAFRCGVEFVAATETTNPVQATAVLVLRRRLASFSAYASPDSSEQVPARAKRFVAHFCKAATKAVGIAARRAWLTLETVLAGPEIWNAAGATFSSSEAQAFRRQMEALLDVINLAGLPIESPGSQRRYFRELRTARGAGLATVKLVETAEIELGRHALNGSGSSGGEDHDTWKPFEEIADELRQEGRPLLAQLSTLRLPWNRPLFPELVDFYLGSILQHDSVLVRNLSELDGPGNHWRCLELISRILDNRGDEIETLLDKAETYASNDGPCERDADAIQRLFRQGLSRFLHGDYLESVTHFTAALKLDATNHEIYKHRGDAYRLQGENERAVADFEAALRLHPTDPAVLVSRAAAYLSLEEFDRAVADCSSALESSPDNAAAYRIRGSAYSALESVDAAIADLNEAIRLAPADEEAYYRRGMLSMEKRDYERAIPDFNQVLRLNKHRVHAYLQRGRAYRHLNNYKSAVRDYSEVLRRHPNNVQAYACRGSAYRLRGDLDLAQADYEKALSLEPGDARIRCSFGVLHRIKGDLPSALAELSEAVRQEPNNWSALYHRGKIAVLRGRFDEALVDLNAALALNRRVPVAYLSRATVYDHAKRFQEALQDASQAITLDPHSAIAHLVRGIIHNHREAYDSAEVDLTEAIARNARLAWAYHERSLAFTGQGKYGEAIADCNEFLALEPRNAQGFAHRSTVYQLAGDAEKSLVDYTLAAQLDPQCLRSAWDKGRAEAVQLATICRLADEIDGLRPQPQVAADPPMAPFRIVVQPWPKGSVGVARTAGAGGAPTEAPTLQAASAKTDADDSLPATDGCQSEPEAPAVYLNRMDRPIYSAVKVRKRSDDVADYVVDDSKPWDKWKKPALIVTGLAAAVFVFFMFGSTRSDRVPVHPVQGQAFFEGKPMPNAIVLLEPTGWEIATFPKPRAIVRDDGTFILATYGKDDGAPIGEYKVSVQWFVKPENRQEVEGGSIAKNVLPARYANPETSGLTVNIKQGANLIPPFQLRR